MCKISTKKNKTKATPNLGFIILPLAAKKVKYFSAKEGFKSNS